jgi:hypothetical protein
MEEVDPETALTAAESERERRRERAVDALEWFRGREGLVPRDEAVAVLADAHGWSEAQANRAIGDVVGDLVDPVQQVVHPERGKLAGIVAYHEYPESGAYGYVDYDDVAGRRKRVVCSECVEKADSDAEVAHATEGEGTTPAEATWSELVTAVEAHYEAEHNVEPSEVVVGASLASGTTISGSTAFHAGNDGIGSGLDADSLEGNEPSDLGASQAEELYIFGDNGGGIGYDVSADSTFNISGTPGSGFGAGVDAVQANDGFIYLSGDNGGGSKYDPAADSHSNVAYNPDGSGFGEDSGIARDQI